MGFIIIKYIRPTVGPKFREREDRPAGRGSIVNLAPGFLLRYFGIIKIISGDTSSLYVLVPVPMASSYGVDDFIIKNTLEHFDVTTHPLSS